MKLKRWSEPIGIMEDTNRESDIFGQPLVNQPGEKWEYGVSMDWVGRLIERVTGMSLGAYFEQNICSPLRMRKTTFCPTADMKANLAFLHERTANGQIQLRENGHLLSTPLRASSEEEANSILHSGGAGLFSTPSDYCRMCPTLPAVLLELTEAPTEIIAALLNHGTHLETGHQLLQRETLNGKYRNTILLYQLLTCKSFFRNAQEPDP